MSISSLDFYTIPSSDRLRSHYKCLRCAAADQRRRCILYQVLENRVPSKYQRKFRDEPLISYDREDGEISFIGPKELFDGIRKDGDTMRAIRERQLQGLIK